MKRPYSIWHKWFYRIPKCFVKLLKNFNSYFTKARENTYYSECKLKSKFEILCDQVKASVKYGFTIDDYFPMGIDVKGKKVDDYIADSMNVVALYSLNSAQDSSYMSRGCDELCLLRDKWVFSQLSEKYGLNVPMTRGLIRNGEVVQINNSLISCFEDISKKELNVMFKPITGSGGNGIFHLCVHEGKILIKGKEYSVAELKEKVKKGNYLIQDFIDNQHDGMKALYSNAINTLRITVAKKGEKCVVLGRMCMLGAHGTDCSNWHFGGVAVNLKADGTLDKYGYCLKEGKIENHPNSNIRFEGYRIPYFEEAIELAKNATKLFYGFVSIGWDIAITANGPVIIEGNDMWGVVAHQMVENRGWRQMWEEYHGKMNL